MKYFPIILVAAFSTLYLIQANKFEESKTDTNPYLLKGKVLCDDPDNCYGAMITLMQDGVELTHVQITDSPEFEIYRTLKFGSKFKLRYSSPVYPTAEIEYFAKPINDNKETQILRVKTLVWNAKTFKFINLTDKP